MSPQQLHRRMFGARERGAVLVQVALALTVLGGFCAMSIDFGLLMVARGQAQTAADAGALAGAIALGFDAPLDEFSEIEQSAKAVASRNLVAQQSADVTSTDVNWRQCNVNGFPPPPDRPFLKNCVAVSAYRNHARSNALPTFFGRLVGIGDQGVQARAAAMIVPSNASDCVWPLAIPDHWTNLSAAPTFVKYGATGPPTLAPQADIYAPPSMTNPGSGFTLPVTLAVKFDLPLTLTTPSPPNFTQPTEPGRFVPVRVPRHDGGFGFADNLASCNNSDVPVTIGDRLNVEATDTLATVLAAAAGRTADDPNATWNPITLRVENSCAGVPPCPPMSPRLVVLPLFDVNTYETTRWSAGVPGATPEIWVVNFVGFFITRATDTSIEGQLTIAPGRVVMGKPMVGYDWAFLRTPILTR